MKFNMNSLEGKLNQFSHIKGSYDNNSWLMPPQNHSLVEMLEDYFVIKFTKNFMKNN